MSYQPLKISKIVMEHPVDFTESNIFHHETLEWVWQAHTGTKPSKTVLRTQNALFYFLWNILFVILERNIKYLRIPMSRIKLNYATLIEYYKFEVPTYAILLKWDIFAWQLYNIKYQPRSPLSP